MTVSFVPALVAPIAAPPERPQFFAVGNSGNPDSGRLTEHDIRPRWWPGAESAVRHSVRHEK